MMELSRAHTPCALPPWYLGDDPYQLCQGVLLLFYFPVTVHKKPDSELSLQSACATKFATVIWTTWNYECWRDQKASLKARD